MPDNIDDFEQGGVSGDGARVHASLASSNDELCFPNPAKRVLKAIVSDGQGGGVRDLRLSDTDLFEGTETDF